MLRSLLVRSSRSNSHNVQFRSVGTQPNSPLNLDPSLQALLADVDISLIKNKSKHLPKGPRELEIWDGPSEEAYSLINEDISHTADEHLTRKSPAAHYGSLRTGATILPFELHASISRLISGLLSR
jgi:hypothetical protein